MLKNSVGSLLRLENMFKAQVLARPSKTVKSPYMADILINGKEELAHCPGLSCCGLVKTGEDVWVEARDQTKPSKAQSNFTIQLAIARDSGEQVGVHPVLGNRLAVSLIRQKAIPFDFEYDPKEDIYTEVTYGSSRFDIEIRNSTKNIIEVKYVPVALHEDIDFLEYDPAKYKKKNPKDKLALFPVGEKGVKILKGQPLSPRAVKHLEEMTRLLKSKFVSSATLLFIVTRGDIEKFKISQTDKKYLQALRAAAKAGVSVRAVKVAWKNCEAMFVQELQVTL